MNNLYRIASGLTITLILSASSPAFAQFRNGLTSINRQETGDTWTRSNLKIDEVEKFKSKTIQEADGTKIQLSSFGPNAFSDLIFKDGEFKGRSFASTDPEVPDPVVTGIVEDFSVYYEADRSRVTKVKGNIKSGSNGVYTETLFDNSVYLD